MGAHGRGEERAATEMNRQTDSTKQELLTLVGGSELTGAAGSRARRSLHARQSCGCSEGISLVTEDSRARVAALWLQPPGGGGPLTFALSVPERL